MAAESASRCRNNYSPGRLKITLKITLRIMLKIMLKRIHTIIPVISCFLLSSQPKFLLISDDTV
jgi:hypothetical protein